MSGKQLISAGEAARLLGMSRRQFSRWSSRLPSVREGCGWRYYWREDVLRFRDFVQGEPMQQPKQHGNKKDYWD